MTKRRKKARTITATLSAEASARLAAECCPLHQAHVKDGMQLTRKSRLWKRGDGSWTARFVYSRPEEPGFTTTVVVKGIVFQ